jgi:hypothetical protein
LQYLFENFFCKVCVRCLSVETFNTK